MTSFPAPSGFAPYYSWIGAPTTFNGTNALTGGDSCKTSFPHCAYMHNPHEFPVSISAVKFRISTDMSHSRGESQPMVHFRRSGLYHRGFGHGGGHDTGSRIPLLWSGAAKVCSDHDMGLHGLVFRHHFPMVFLGLFSGLFGTRKERLYWRSQALWFNEYTRRP